MLPTGGSPTWELVIAEVERLAAAGDAPSKLEDIVAAVQRLDPSRFPGNPALVEQLHDQVLGDVDKLELQLQRAQDRKQAGQVRSTDSLTVPAGYEDAVADYFRRLSKTP